MAFNALLETQGLDLQSESAVERALHAYRNNSAEFADSLHSGLCSAAERGPMLSFDVRAARLPGAELIPA